MCFGGGGGGGSATKVDAQGVSRTADGAQDNYTTPYGSNDTSAQNTPFGKAIAYGLGVADVNGNPINKTAGAGSSDTPRNRYTWAAPLPDPMGTPTNTDPASSTTVVGGGLGVADQDGVPGAMSRGSAGLNTLSM